MNACECLFVMALLYAVFGKGQSVSAWTWTNKIKSGGDDKENYPISCSTFHLIHLMFYLCCIVVWFGVVCFSIDMHVHFQCLYISFAYMLW